MVGVVILIIGVAMIFGSMYISGQVAEGRQRISAAQSQINRGSGLFNLNPITQEVGKGITRSAQKKINRYSQEADRYAEMASWLKIGGIILIVVGAGVSILGSRKKS
jgi:hypothetical protein